MRYRQHSNGLIVNLGPWNNDNGSWTIVCLGPALARIWTAVTMRYRPEILDHEHYEVQLKSDILLTN